MKLLGIVLAVIGALMLAYQGFTYTKTHTVADVGPVQLQTHEKKTVPLPPIVGGVTLIAGVCILIFGARKTT